MADERGIVYIVTDVEKSECKRVCEECGGEAGGYRYWRNADGTFGFGIKFDSNNEAILMRHRRDCELGKLDPG